ncbi:dihydropteroate synthase [Terasakiella sp. A23]|uniref:dihydropteroate synthase n=1 Tax=Terasakiella sp. FCG-A23 TaxID=3080561 RepID=UPI002954A9A8|nr:dihydropteroate synthase [Terasakiella sp. A23]MDV7339119.1 dihydropteroate synthase [Terasakiella sp. A23]
MNEFGSALPRGFCTSDTDLSQTLYVRPLAPFVDGGFDFPVYEVAVRMDGNVGRFTATHEGLMAWADVEGEDVVAHIGKLLEHIESPVRSFSGLTVSNRPLIMGIVNVTPDSFSDGGDNYDVSNAIAHGKEMLANGADILDIGGESTRPGAAPVKQEEELRRVIPVIEGLKHTGAKISIDTRHAAVMKAAVEAGADIINDVTALEGEGALEVAADLKVPVMLMHMQGEPQTMQTNPTYEDCTLDIYDYLHERVRACEAAGIKRSDICVDPGIGFGKTLDHNMSILNQLGLYHGLGSAVLLGASRKSFIAKICGDVPAKDRVPGSLSAAIKGANAGVQIVRVHDVVETKQALDVWVA